MGRIRLKVFNFSIFIICTFNVFEWSSKPISCFTDFGSVSYDCWKTICAGNSNALFWFILVFSVSNVYHVI